MGDAGLDILSAGRESAPAGLVELFSDWYWEQDEAFRFTLISGPRAAQIASGGNADRYVGKCRWEMGDAEPLDGDWSAHRAVLARREPFRNFLMRRRLPDGTIRYFSVNGHPRFDAGGAFRGYCGTGTDVTERVEAEERLKRFRLALDHSADYIALIDAETLGYLDINASYASALGYTREEMLRLRVFDIVAGDADEVRRIYHRLLEAPDQPHTWRGHFRRKDGSLLPAEGSRHAMRSEGRWVVAAIARDLSERLAAEESLQRFRLALDHAADFIGLIDAETLRYLDVNESLARALGYSREEMLGMDVRAVIQGAWRETAERDYRELVSGARKTQDYRGNFQARDGSVIPVEGRRHVMRSNGRWIIAGISRDLRERLAAEEAMRKQDSFYRSLIENASDAICAAGLDWRFVFVSAAASQMTGFAADELIGRRFGEPSHIEGAEDLRARLEKAFAAGASQQRVEVPGRRKDGTPRTFEVVISKGKGPGGEPIYVIVSRDVTERIAARERLAQSERELRTLLGRTPDIIARWDRELRCLYVNDAVEKATGAPPQAFIGLRVQDMPSVEPFPQVLRSNCEKVFATGAERSAEFAFPSHAGETIHFEMIFIPERGGDGEVASVLTIGRDMTRRVRAEEQVLRREKEFRTLAHNAPDGILRFDRQLRCVFANKAISKASGRPAVAIVGQTLAELNLGRDMERLWAEAMGRVFATGHTETAQFTYESVHGLRHYEGRFAPEHDASGNVESVLLISRDTTDSKQAERAMAENEARLRSIVQASVEPLLLVDGDGTTIFANPAAATLFGRPVAELEGAPLGLPLGDGRPAEVSIVLPEGAVRPAEMQFGATVLAGREVLVVSLHDVSERKRYEDHIQHLATHDRLTSLPNRALLADRVEQAIVSAWRTTGSLALLFVDLDQFKLVNDSFGHVAGDALLMEVARRLRATVRDGDTVARLSGDEFVILLTNLTRPGHSAFVAQKIAQALDAPIELEGAALRLSASIGISLYPDDGDSLDTLLQTADAAMYRAKDLGRNGYQYYSAELGEQARSRVETEAGLRRALEREELVLHYQPQVDLASGKVVGVEALLRWQHPERGLVSPAAFIGVAEETGLIVPIGEWALQTACREAAGWMRAGLGDIRMAVNLSARQFWRGSVTEVVRRALEQSGLPPALLDVEITESVVARDLAQVTQSLEQLLRMGVGVAIDDFGVGYSSLSYLRTLPIRKLKVDRSFITAIPEDVPASSLVREIIQLAHVLSLEVVAEGVENAEQARFLRDAGCEAMQGYLFARPMPANECAALLRAGRRLSLA